MNINVFLMCYNESVLLPHTIKHYKKYMPSCHITVYDNESTDNSAELAKSLGCTVVEFKTNNRSENKYRQELKNKCWKTVESGWIIVADMDEFLYVTEEQLKEEHEKGTTILKVQGLEMIGESNTLDLTDIDLQSIRKYFLNKWESKNLCFLKDSIQDINYSCGAHKCKPVGKVQYSSVTYLNKHMNMLGLPFFTQKILQRYERSMSDRKFGMSIHYIDNVQEIEKRYADALKSSSLID